MKTIDIYQIIKETNIDAIISEIIAKKTKKDINIVKNEIDNLIQNKINIIGQKLTNEKVNESEMQNLKDLSLDDFLSDKIIIKEE